MKLDNRMIAMIKKLETAGYSAYLCGESIWKHLLGQKLEEYKMVTSAPPFFLEKEIKEGWLEVLFEMDQLTYISSCAFQLDTLLYHPRYGIIDESFVLEDVEKKVLKINEKKKGVIAEEDILRGFIYHIKGFLTADSRLEKLFLSTEIKKITHGMQKYIHSLLLFSLPGTVLSNYPKLFCQFIQITPIKIALLDCTRNDIVLRLTAFLLDENIKRATCILEKLNYSSAIRESVVQLLQFHSYPLSRKNINRFFEKFESKNISYWLSFNRAKAVYYNQLEKIFELDELEKWIQAYRDRKEDFLKKDLSIKEEDLLELGYKKEEIPRIFDALLALVRKDEIKNSYEELRRKALTFRQENE